MDQERSFERRQPTGLPALLDGSRKMGVNVRARTLGLRVPNLQIIHKIETNEQIERGERPGYFKYGTKVYPAASVVFLKADEVRRYDYKAHESDKPTTLCASADGIVPLDEISDPPCDNCAKCQYGQWKEDPTEINPKTGKPRRIPPDCTPGIAFLGLIPEENCAPFWLICQKTAEPAARKFLREFYEDPVSVYLHEYRVRLTSEQATSDARGRVGLTWYQPVFTVERRTGADLYLAAFNAVQQAAIRYVPFLGRGATEEPPDTGDVPLPSDQDAPPGADDDQVPFQRGASPGSRVWGGDMGVEERRRRAARQADAMREGHIPTFYADGQRTFMRTTEWGGYWIDSLGERHNCGHTTHESDGAAKTCAMSVWQQARPVE